MDGLKEVLSFLGAVFGLISALIPLLGYMADRRRRASAPGRKHARTRSWRRPNARPTPRVLLGRTNSVLFACEHYRHLAGL